MSCGRDVSGSTIVNKGNTSQAGEYAGNFFKKNAFNDGVGWFVGANISPREKLLKQTCSCGKRSKNSKKDMVQSHLVMSSQIMSMKMLLKN